MFKHESRFNDTTPDVPVYRSLAVLRSSQSSAPFPKSQDNTSQRILHPTKGVAGWAIFRDAVVKCLARRHQWNVVETRSFTAA